MPLDPYERRAALDPGLLPDEHWPGLDELRQKQLAALVDLREAGSAVAESERPYAGRPPERPEAGSALYEARRTYAETRAEVEEIVAEVLREIRERLPEWRAALREPAVAREQEVAELRDRLAELESEAVEEQRLATWIDRADPDKITPGLYPWSRLAATREPAGDAPFSRRAVQAPSTEPDPSAIPSGAAA